MDPALVTLDGDIVAGNVNTSASSTPDDIAGLVGPSSSDNLIGTGGSGGLVAGQGGNQVGVRIANVGLGSLGDNGGPTETLAIGPGSFALENGVTETTATTDQRGVARPVNEPSDVGAYQYSVAAFSVVPFSSASQNAAVTSTFAPLEAIVTDSYGNPVSDVSVTFAAIAGANGASGSFAGNAIVTTNIYGVAIAPALTAGQIAGTFTVTASVSGVTNPGNFNLTNSPSVPATMIAVGGTPQNALIGSGYGSFLQAEVVDGYGNPVSNVPVTFAAPLAGPTGSFDALATVPTNALGIATAPGFSANQVPGNFTVTASVGGVANAAGFDLTNTPEVPFSIVPFSGAVQSEMVGNAFAPLEAFVSDSLGNPVSSASVTFNVVAGSSGASGVFTGATTVTTNTQGVAIAPALTAGTTAGAFIATASVNGVANSADFDLTNIPGTPATITAVGGAAQNTPIGSPFRTSLQAQVLDAFGNPLAGVPVIFFAPSTGPTGTFHALTTVPTNVLGIATAPAFSANHVVGNFTVTATSAGIVTPATFTLTNTAVPAAIQTFAGSGQHASVNSAFTTPLEARITDAAGKPVNDITVDFELPVSAADGTFAGSAAIVTNSNGIATAPTLTANTVAGGFTVSAWVAEVKTPATFTLTNLPLGPSAVNVIAGSGQAAALGSAYAKTLQAQVVDQYGNPVAGVPVTFKTPSTGPSGTFGSNKTATASTNANGIASVSITANHTAGNFQVTAAAAHVTTPATFNLTNSPIHALKIVAGSPQTASTGKPFGTALQVKAVDAAGNPLQGVSITFTAPSSGASGTFATSATVLTNANGIAIAPAFTANDLAGSFTVNSELTSPVAGMSLVKFILRNVL